MKNLIYFDNAATTFPKPIQVRAAAADTVKYYCANPGRSSHKLAMKAAETVYSCREKLGKTFGCEPENAIFCLNATHAVNTALKSLLRKGDHVLISDIEHNAVYRPIAALAEDGFISYDIYNSSAKNITSELSKKIKPNTAVITACHHSNICNLIMPISKIGAFCKSRGIIFLVDASQSAGAIGIDMRAQSIDVLCAPAHKGLYGIPGCGFVLFNEKLPKSRELKTFAEGGNGVDSKNPLMPDFLPERLEAGTLPLPAISALSAGLDFVNRCGIENIHRKEKALCALMRKGLSDIKGIKIHSQTDGSILLFSADGIPSEKFAAMLAEKGVCVRAGLHCCPLAHKKLGTPQDDGAVRVSFGASNTEDEVRYFVNLCK